MESDFEDELVLVQLPDMESDFLLANKSNIKILGLDTPGPILQIGNTHYIGSLKESVGSHLLFERDPTNAERLLHVGTTTTLMACTRIALQEKGAEEEEDRGGEEEEEEEEEEEAREGAAAAAKERTVSVPTSKKGSKPSPKRRAVAAGLRRPSSIAKGKRPAKDTDENENDE